MSFDKLLKIANLQVIQGGSVDNLLLFCVQAIKNSDFYEAWKYICKAEKLGQHMFEVFMLKGYICEQKGSWEKAIRYYDQALKKKSADKTALAQYFKQVANVTLADSALLRERKKSFSTKKKKYKSKLTKYVTEYIKGTGQSRPQSRKSSQQHDKPSRVNIIIPVYKDIGSLKLCINSVLRSKNTLNYHLLIINDASPEKSIHQFLSRLERQHKITLITNKTNEGFVRSVNRGFFYFDSGDCVILNSDTMVFSNWLDRLHQAAYSDQKIASVTPLSNNSELTSYPKVQMNNPVRDNNQARQIDKIASSVNIGSYVDIPSGVGFCMYIKRQCLDECGGFNEHLITKGYGDEAEFCLRTKKYGWKHICTTDTFVFHEGGKSFSLHQKMQLASDNMKLLYQIYPDYRQVYIDFLRKDPLFYARRNIERQYLCRETKKLKLLVLGFFQYLGEAEVIQSYQKGMDLYWLRPEKIVKGSIVYRLGRNHEQTPATLKYRLPAEKKYLLTDLEKLAPDLVEYRDTRYSIKFLHDLPEYLDCPYTIRPNDYSLLCPANYLLDYNKAICHFEKVTSKDCERCLGRKSRPGHKTKQLKMFVRHAKFLSLSNQYAVLCFRRYEKKVRLHLSTKHFLSNQAPLKNEAMHHCTKAKTLKIAIVHDVWAHSGYQVLLDMARYCARKKLNIEFLVFGRSLNDAELQNTSRVSIMYQLEKNEFQQLVPDFGVRAVLFLHQWHVLNVPELEYIATLPLKFFAFRTGVFTCDFIKNMGFRLFHSDADYKHICRALEKLQQETFDAS